MILKRYLICLWFHGGPYEVKRMAPWPTSKAIRSKTFTKAGFDYFRPLKIRQGYDGVKVLAYITVWAIHIELVDDMTAEQFS